MGYNAELVVATGAQAKQSVKRNQLDLILMDIRLKGDMDGIQTAREIHRLHDIPIVFLTAYADSTTLERAKTIEPYGYIIKPVEDRELQSTIELALYKHSIEINRKRSEYKFRTIFENANDVIVFVDRQGRVLNVNRTTKKILGYNASEIVGKNFFQLKVFDKKTSIYIKNSFRQMIKSKRPIGLVELELRTKNGERIIVETSTTYLKKENGIDGFLSIIRDITKRKKTEMALRTEQKRRKELTNKIINLQEEERLYIASEIHDDLLQGLVAVLYFLQMIDLTKLNRKAKKQREHVIAVIKDSISKGRALISGIEPLRGLNKDLYKVLKELIDQKFFSTDIRVIFKHPRATPNISLFATTNIIRIIQETLTNISKHAKATEVSVKITLQNSMFTIEIEDNGIGFDPNAHIPKDTEHYGIVTMHERARLLDGTLTITGHANKGTLVKCVFPLEDLSPCEKSRP